MVRDCRSRLATVPVTPALLVADSARLLRAGARVVRCYAATTVVGVAKEATMTKKSQCKYIYVHGVRLPGDSVEVTYVDQYGRTVKKRLVQEYIEGLESVKLGEFVKFSLKQDPKFDRSRVPITVKTSRGDVRMSIDLDAAFSSKGRRVPVRYNDPVAGWGYQLELENLSADDAAKLAELSLRGLSYGKNDAKMHAGRALWALEHLEQGALGRWLREADPQTLAEDNYHSFIINLIYLRRHNPGYVEKLFGDDPELRSRVLALLPLLSTETDIDTRIPAVELTSFRDMLADIAPLHSAAFSAFAVSRDSNAGLLEQLSRANENEVAAVIIAAMAQAGSIAHASGAAPQILTHHAENMVRGAFDLTELLKAYGIEGLVTDEGRGHALKLIDSLSVLLSHPRAGGYPRDGRVGEQLPPIMGSRGRLSAIDAFRGRSSRASDSWASIVDRLPAGLATIKHYQPGLLVEGNFGPRSAGEGDSPRFGAADDYATAAPQTMVEVFDLLCALMAIPDPGPLVGAMRETASNVESVRDLEARETALAKECDAAHAECEVWRAEMRKAHDSYEKLKAAAIEASTTAQALRKAAERAEQSAEGAAKDDGHYQLTSSKELVHILGSWNGYQDPTMANIAPEERKGYGRHVVTARFVAHTGTEVWVKLADHGESDSVSFLHSQDVSGFNSIGQTWNREYAGRVVELSRSQTGGTPYRAAASSTAVTLHFPGVPTSSEASREKRAKADRDSERATQAAHDAAAFADRQFQARDNALKKHTEIESEWFKAQAKFKAIEDSLLGVRDLLENA